MIEARLDRQRRELIQAADERKAPRNDTQEVAKRKRAGEPADDLIAQAAPRRRDWSAWRELNEVERLSAPCFEIPNVKFPNVPEGGEEHNTIVREWARRHRRASRRTGRLGQSSLFDLERAPRCLVPASCFIAVPD